MGVVNSLFSSSFLPSPPCFSPLLCFPLSLPHFLFFFSQHLPGVLEYLVQGQEEEAPDLEILKPADQEKIRQRENRMIVRNSWKSLCDSCRKQSVLEMDGSGRYIRSTALPGTVAKAKSYCNQHYLKKIKPNKSYLEHIVFPSAVWLWGMLYGEPFLPAAPVSFVCRLLLPSERKRVKQYRALDTSLVSALLLFL